MIAIKTQISLTFHNRAHDSAIADSGAWFQFAPWEMKPERLPVRLMFHSEETLFSPPLSALVWGATFYRSEICCTLKRVIALFFRAHFVERVAFGATIPRWSKI